MPNFHYVTTYANGQSIDHGMTPPQRNAPGELYVDHCARTDANRYEDLYIGSIGHQVTWAKRKVHRTSPCAILHYVVGGKGHFNGQEVQYGDVFFARSYHEYTITSSPGSPLDYYWITFGGQKLKDLIKQCRLDELPPIQKYDFTDEVIRIFDEAIYEDHSKNDLNLYLIGLCYQMLSFHKQMSLRFEKANDRNKDYFYFRDAVDFITKNIGNNISAHDVSKHLHISTSYCRMIFHKYCQHSPQEMIIIKRFDQARSDLEFTTHSVKEIAARAGYPDQSLFSRQFKKLYGISPLKYRNQVNRNHFEI